MSLVRTSVMVFSFVFSGVISAGQVYSGWVKVNQISLGFNIKRVNLDFNLSTDPIPNPAECGIAASAAIDEDQVNMDQLYSLALTQFASNREIQLVVYDDRCSNSGRVKILSINAR